jgi:hypothetical protein
MLCMWCSKLDVKEGYNCGYLMYPLSGAANFTRFQRNVNFKLDEEQFCNKTVEIKIRYAERRGNHAFDY